MDLKQFFETYKIEVQTPSSKSIQPDLQQTLSSNAKMEAKRHMQIEQEIPEPEKRFKQDDVPSSSAVKSPEINGLISFESNEFEQQLGAMKLLTPKRHRNITGQKLKPTSNIMTRSQAELKKSYGIKNDGSDDDERHEKMGMKEEKKKTRIEKGNTAKLPKHICSKIEDADNEEDETLSTMDDSTTLDDSEDDYMPEKRKRDTYIDFDDDKMESSQDGSQKKPDISAGYQVREKHEKNSSDGSKQAVIQKPKLQYSHNNKVDPFSTGEILFCDASTKKVHSKELRELNFKKFKTSNNMEVDFSKFEDAAKYAPCDFTKKLCLAVGVTFRLEKEKLKRQSHTTADFRLDRPEVEPLKWPATFDKSKVTVDSKIMTPMGIAVDYLAPFHELSVKSVASCDLDVLLDAYMDPFLQEFKKDKVYFLYALPTTKTIKYIPLSSSFVTTPIEAIVQSLGLNDPKFTLYKSRLTGSFLEKIRICISNGRSRRSDKKLHDKMAADLKSALSNL